MQLQSRIAERSKLVPGKKIDKMRQISADVSLNSQWAAGQHGYSFLGSIIICGDCTTITFAILILYFYLLYIKY